MKTITLQGTQEQINNLFLKSLDFDTDRLPSKVETRVYVLEVNSDELYFNFDTISDEEFQNLAEENGRVYTLKGFQDAFNSEEINSSIDVIRFISVPLFL